MREIIVYNFSPDLPKQCPTVQLLTFNCWEVDSTV